MKNIKLTEAEKNLMEIIWENERIFMKDILQNYPDPKPAATTVATLLKRLQNKNMVGYRSYGNSREYFALVLKNKYFNEEMSEMISKFFNNSVTQFASFFTENSKLSQKQLKELRDIIDKEITD